MKDYMKKYVKPQLRVERFISNDFVSACYYMNCDMVGWLQDVNHNGKYDGKQESFQNSGNGETLVHKRSSTISSDVYTSAKAQTGLIGFLRWLAELVFQTGQNYNNENHFKQINPGLYIIEENGGIYGSTRPTYPVPGHPNRS